MATKEEEEEEEEVELEVKGDVDFHQVYEFKIFLFFLLNIYLSYPISTIKYFFRVSPLYQP
jgi:hypothetical protein